mgnify:FL=1
MTKKHFEAAAALVTAILHDEWTPEAPEWAPRSFTDTSNEPAYERAVFSAEAFICLFREFNQRFDQQRFLRACGLAAKDGVQ